MPAATPRLRLLPLAAAAMLAAAPAHAQWVFTPSVGLTGTWTDNIDLREKDLAQSQFVTELRPQLALAGQNRHLKLSAVAAVERYAYSDRDDVRNPSDSLTTYAANLQGTLVDQLLYVDATANRSRRSLQPFSPGAEDNPYSLENQTDVRSWSVSPYLVRRLGRDATMQLRYSRDGVESGLRNLFGNSTSDTVMLNLASGTSTKSLGWGFNHVRQDVDNRLVGESSSESTSGSLRYQFTRSWAATLTGGYDKYDFEGPGGNTSGRSWSVGGVWTPSARTSVQAAVGRHLYGQTGSLLASARSRHTAINLQYADVITSSRRQSVLPATFDTAAMLDRMFNAVVADPLERERLVAAYMLENGLPASLAESINFLSNRWARQKELRASVGWRGGRSTALLSAYRSERIALSDQQSDSALLGSQFSSLNDNVRQHGANLNFSYRVGPRTNLNTGADYSFRESLTTGIETQRRELYVRMQRDVGRYLSTNLELRRRSGGSDFAGRRDYTEHAVVASLNLKY